VYFIVLKLYPNTKPFSKTNATETTGKSEDVLVSFRYSVCTHRPATIKINKGWNRIPVNSPWAFLWLDIQFIVIDVNFGDVHFKEIGLKFDCSPRGPKVGPRWRLEGISLDGWWGRRRRRKHWKTEGEVH
jgi:hypothetical protein